MPWISSASSDIGSREQQQDRYLIEQSNNGDSHLLVVADGAGGHKTGALAAQAAIDCISENLDFLWTSKNPEARLNELILECNRRVLAVADDEMACTTLVMVLTKDDEIFWGHVGDSRLYLIRNHQIIAQTIDHSVVELQGQQTSESVKAAINASSSELYMCLGALTDITPQISSSLVKEGDTLLLCSDGLWGQVDMQSAIAGLSEKTLTNEALGYWVEKAKISKSDTSDNITLVAGRFTAKTEPNFSLTKVISRLWTK